MTGETRRMNTAAPYRRPSHRSSSGLYKSKTTLSEPGYVAHVTIALVWFNGLGWYFTVSVEGFTFTGDAPRPLVERVADKRLWPLGKQLAECSFAAEDAASELCRRLGLVAEAFSPFEPTRAE